jgi:two-component system response regulator MprA
MPTESKTSILIVEDDAPSARTLARMLTDDGYATEIAFDGARAIARLGRDPLPDVLLIDYRLPHVDGIAVATYARTRRPDMRLIFLTSYAELVARTHSALAPPMVILAKPVSYAELTAELARASP